MGRVSPGHIEIPVDECCFAGSGVIVVKAPTGVRYINGGRWVEGYVERVVDIMGCTSVVDAEDPTLEDWKADVGGLMDFEGEEMDEFDHGWVRLKAGKIFAYPVGGEHGEFFG